MHAKIFRDECCCDLTSYGPSLDSAQHLGHDAKTTDPTKEELDKVHPKTALSGSTTLGTLWLQVTMDL